VQVRAVTADALVRTLYPRIGDFDTVYRVRFRRGAGAPLGQRAFLLRMAGPRGRLDFPFGPGTIDPRGTAPRSPDAAGRSRTDEPPDR
jgi:hypothetical protein